MSREPVLLWLGDPLSPWRSDGAEQRLRRDLAARSGWSLVSVGRGDGAPETFPEPLTDAYLAMGRHLADAEGRVPVAIGGHGFGAGLAAAATLLARRYGEESPAATVLLAPLLDARLASPSWRRLGAERDRGLVEAALAAYAPGLDRADPLLSPLLAPDLEGLPPTVIVTAAADPMRDDGERFAERLQAAGGTVLGHRYPGTDHAQACGGEVSAEGAAVVGGLAGALRLILSRSTHGRQAGSSRQADAPRRAPA